MNNLEKDNGVNKQIMLDYMKENNLTVEKFCQHCKIGKSTYYNIIKGGDFNLLSLFKIAKRLDVPIYKFFE